MDAPIGPVAFQASALLAPALSLLGWQLLYTYLTVAKIIALDTGFDCLYPVWGI